MAKSITVDPQKLENAASAIDTQSSEYERIYKQLFNEVDGMAAAWQGADNIAFSAQIAGFTGDFQAMISMLRQYSEFLKTSAKAYRETQNDIANQTRRLAN